MTDLPTVSQIIGVVSEVADSCARSVEAKQVVPVEDAPSFADGIAVRVPDAGALAIILKGAARIVRVSEDAIADAIRSYYLDTHNLAEGAGAAPLAAAAAEAELNRSASVGVVLGGGNIDMPVFRKVLAGETPRIG